jgi:hypothetical protein
MELGRAVGKERSEPAVEEGKEREKVEKCRDTSTSPDEEEREEILIPRQDWAAINS